MAQQNNNQKKNTTKHPSPMFGAPAAMPVNTKQLTRDLWIQTQHHAVKSWNLEHHPLRECNNTVLWSKKTCSHYMWKKQAHKKSAQNKNAFEHHRYVYLHGREVKKLIATWHFFHHIPLYLVHHRCLTCSFCWRSLDFNDYHDYQEHHWIEAWKIPNLLRWHRHEMIRSSQQLESTTTFQEFNPWKFKSKKTHD